MIECHIWRSNMTVSFLLFANMMLIVYIVDSTTLKYIQSYANVPLTSKLAGLWSFTSNIIWPQSSGNHTWNEHEKNRKYLQYSSKNTSKFTVRQIFSRKSSLNNYLNNDKILKIYIIYIFLNDQSCDF